MISSRSRRVLVACVGVGAMVATPSALAGPPSAVAQYVEMIPTSTGFQAVSQSKTTPISKPVQRSITREGGSDAQALTKIVTTTSPARRPTRSKRSIGSGTAVGSTRLPTPAIPTAVIHSGAAGELVLALPATVIVALALALLGNPGQRRTD
jgi:hypothetical protein